MTVFPQPYGTEVNGRRGYSPMRQPGQKDRGDEKVKYCFSRHGEKIEYQVFEKESLIAEFSYSIQSTEDPKEELFFRAPSERFWIHHLTWKQEDPAPETIDAILQFLQYKCRSAGLGAMYVRISTQNMLVWEMYARYGFYNIAEEEVQIPRGGCTYDYVMKYVLPGNRDEEYQMHIRRTIEF